MTRKSARRTSSDAIKRYVATLLPEERAWIQAVIDKMPLGERVVITEATMREIIAKRPKMTQ